LPDVEADDVPELSKMTVRLGQSPLKSPSEAEGDSWVPGESTSCTFSPPHERPHNLLQRSLGHCRTLQRYLQGGRPEIKGGGLYVVVGWGLYVVAGR